MLISFRLGGALVDLGSVAFMPGGEDSRPVDEAGPANRNMQNCHYFHLCIATLGPRNGSREKLSFSS
jgi:hypothetical protein